MKIMATVLLLLVLFLPNVLPQEYAQWDLPEGAVACLGKGNVEEILYSPDGSRIAVISTIGIWLYDTTTYRRITMLAGWTGWSSNVSFSPDGGTLATGGGYHDNTVRLWDVETGEEKRVFTGYRRSVDSVAFSPDGRTLASGSWNRTVELWDVETGEEKEDFTWYMSSGKGLAFSPDGRTLSSASPDGTVLLWKVD